MYMPYRKPKKGSPQHKAMLAGLAKARAVRLANLKNGGGGNGKNKHKPTINANGKKRKKWTRHAPSPAAAPSTEHLSPVRMDRPARIVIAHDDLDVVEPSSSEGRVRIATSRLLLRQAVELLSSIQN